MLDELFRDVTTTEARAWATTSGVTPLLYNHSNFENIIEDNIAPVDSANSEEVNHNELMNFLRQLRTRIHRYVLIFPIVVFRRFSTS